MDEELNDTNRSRRGTWVIVRCYGDKAARVRVWAEQAQHVWVMDNENYTRRAGEMSALLPVGFQRGAVFVDAPDFFDPDPPAEFWQQLTPFSLSD
jgi:hypothetical protein